MTFRPSASDNETVKTIETTLEVKLQRTETITRITCPQCSATGEVRKVEIMPPSGFGSSVTFHRVPDGWWGHGVGLFTVKATCPACFGRPFAGVLADDDPRTRKLDPTPGDEVQTLPLRSSGQEETRAQHVTHLGDSPVDAPVLQPAWQSMLSTPGGAGAVARPLALHLRETITARGPGATVESIHHDTSLLRIAETLEAASARLEEFKPKDATDVDLTPLGTKPFATERAPRLSCSFCGKEQKDVQKLIVGPCIHICNECVGLSQEIIDEGSPARAGSRSGSESTAPDLLDRIDRVCASGGSVSVSGIEQFDDTVLRYANVTISNAKDDERRTRSDGDTAVDALRSALDKAGL
jgi:hypothetical protein